MAEIYGEFKVDDHRARLRAQYAENGFESFKDYELLEMLLFYAVPRRDTQPAARRLLARFGSIAGVLSASDEELRSVEGVGEGSATLIKLAMRLTKKYFESGEKDRVADLDGARTSLFPFFVGEKNERVAILCLDNKNEVLKKEIVSEGSVSSVSANLRRIAASALGSNAAAVIMAHNHPGGVASPSAGDVDTTEKTASVLGAVDVRLLDHLIFSGTDCFSMAANEKFRHIFGG